VRQAVLSQSRATLAAVALAATVYLPALGNRFALDDGAIVERNPAAHGIAAAVQAADQPYWPAVHGAGLWRPLVILSFAADWSASDGDPRWLHAANILWHALAVALVVALLWGYLPGAAALAGGLVFAVHPVHVEAVANLVGRAELMAAVFVLCALLLARTVRERRAAGRKTGVQEALLLVSAGLALLSKEHAAVLPALLVLDDLALSDSGRPRLPWRAYAGVLVLAAAWFVVRGAVEGGVSFGQVAPAFFQLEAGGRLATMLPVVLVLVRLLVWPFDLSADYHPRVVDRLTALGVPALLGLALLLACAALAVLVWRRNRAVAAGLVIIGVAWLPTSNLLFPAGIVIAERTLYLPSVGLVLVAAAGFAALARRAGPRAAAAALAVIVVAFGIRSARRATDWRDSRSLVVASLLTHPESYKVHQSAARVYLHLGDTAAALRSYRVADELYPFDNYLLTEIGAAQIEARQIRGAVRSLRRAVAIDSGYPLTWQLLAHALLLADSTDAALAAARRGVAAGPARPGPARLLAASFLRAGLVDSALAVWPAFERRGGRAFERWLYAAATHAALGDSAGARAAFDSAIRRIPDDSLVFAQLREAQALLRRGRLR
jgi:tetratricopeptide (TPR) repeat protein